MTLARHHACNSNSVLCTVARGLVIQLINLQSEDPHPVLEKDTRYSINNKKRYSFQDSYTCRMDCVCVCVHRYSNIYGGHM